MKILIAGGTGFIGQFLVPSLKGHEITVLGRDKQKIQSIFGEKVKALSWNELNKLHIQNQDIVINLAGENIGDKRWSQKRKQAIKESRVSATSRLANLCAELGESSPRLLNASAVGIYGLHENQPDQAQPVDEGWPVPWGKPTDFVSEVTQAWEASLKPAIDANIKVTIMRFGVVLHPSGGALKKLLPSIKFGMGSIIGSGEQGVSWIHMDDVISAIHFLIEHFEITGPINLMAEPCDQRTFINSLAKAYKRPCVLKTPAFVLKLMLGEMADELIIKGQKANPKRLLDSGFQFNYPTIKNVGW